MLNDPGDAVALCCRGKYGGGKQRVAVDDVIFPCVGAEKRFQLPLEGRSQGGAAAMVHPAAQSEDLRFISPLCLPEGEIVELQPGAVDLPVIVHQNGENAAAAAQRGDDM